MEGFLQKYGKTINLLFAQNDDMGLGALDAIKAAGLTPGKDIQIVTIDGTKDGLTALSQGEFNYVVECNPLLGDKVASVVKDVLAGKKVDKAYTAVDGAFDQAAGHGRTADPQVLSPTTAHWPHHRRGEHCSPRRFPVRLRAERRQTVVDDNVSSRCATSRSRSPE